MISKRRITCFQTLWYVARFSTFVFEPMQEKFMIRVIREIWVSCVEYKTRKFTVEYNYSPHIDRHGYKRCKINYNNTRKLFN